MVRDPAGMSVIQVKLYIKEGETWLQKLCIKFSKDIKTPPRWDAIPPLFIPSISLGFQFFSSLGGERYCDFKVTNKSALLLQQSDNTSQV